MTGNSLIGTIAIISFGIIGGAAVGTQAPIAGAIAQKLGGAAGSIVLYLGGLVGAFGLLVLRGGENISQWRALPFPMLGAGILGLVLLLSLSQTVPRLGAASAVALIIVGQLAATLVIDHFGLFGVAVRSADLSRAAGSFLLLAGVYLIWKQ